MLHALLVLTLLLLLLLLLLLDPFKPGLVNSRILLRWLPIQKIDLLLMAFAHSLLQLHNLIWLLHLSHSQVSTVLLLVLLTLDLLNLSVVQLASLLGIPHQNLLIRLLPLAKYLH